MKIACNLSDALIELIQENKVCVDYVKFALSDSNDEIPVMYKSYGILLPHGLGLDVPQHTGTALSSGINWSRIKKHIEFCDCPFIGLHCAAYQSDFDEQPVTYEMVKQRMGSVLEVWRKNIDTDILIENVPYTSYYETHNPYIIRHAASAELITRLCSEYEVGLLLDLAHAKLTASELNIPTEDYIKLLPLERVREIHAVGTRETEDGLRDNHLEMNDEDYRILEYVLQVTHPEIVTLEYGGFGENFSWRSDKNAIERQLKRILQITGLWMS